MPTDLLRYLAGPSGYSPWWWLVVAVIVMLVAGWYLAVAVWTLPPTTLRSARVIGGLHRRLVARRFTRSVRAITAACRSGAMTPADAVAAYTRTLRSFLTVATGRRVHYMRITDLSNTSLAPAVPAMLSLNTIRFGGPYKGSYADIERLAAEVEGTIKRWI